MKLGELAEQFQLECVGDADTEITGIASLTEAGSGQLAFLFNSAYRSLLATTKAAAVVLQAEDAPGCPKPCLVADSPRLALARIATVFDPAPITMPFVHPAAVVADTAKVGQGVAIGAGAVIASGAEIGDGAVIGAGCHVGDGSRVGAGTRLYPNVVLYHGVHIGAGCIIHAGAIIGADGFGFEWDASGGEFVKIPQVYGVRIGDNVEIGAITTIDRGALNHTEIGDGCKLDNQVQVGHGVTIGAGTVISGCTAIAGSTKVGAHCLIGGGVGIIDNIEIVDGVEITAMTLVSQPIREPGRYSSGTSLMGSREWKRSALGFRRLDEMLRRLRRLESRSGDD